MTIDDWSEQPETEEQEKSKSQIKREFAELQKVGERLVALKPAQIAGFQFSQAMLDALEEYSRIKNRTAQQRHIRRVGKLLADEDMDMVIHGLNRLDSNHPDNQRRLKLMEQWRARLISDGDSALNELTHICPGLDRHYLRQLVRAARREQEANKPAAAAKKIFHYLKELEVW
ncbi:MAG: ribosome biogenesis factor YjgA [Gammaproteobacteria bacterium]|jgi:ribosome-associated protein